MFKRQSLRAVGSGRPLCAPVVRVGGVRCRSDAPSGDRPAGQEKGSSTKPAKESTSSPRNGPNTGRTRQQRAAQVSEEVRMLNRGSPSAKVSGNNSPHPAVRSRSVDADAVVGQSIKARMGANSSSEREGPNAQGAGRVIRAGKGGRHARSERSPAGALEDPTRGGAHVLSQNDRLPNDGEDDDTEDQGPAAPSTQHELILLEQFDKQDITAVPFEPESVTREDFLKLGQGGATIAAGNFEGVIEDRLRLLAEPTQDGFRWAPDIAARMMKGGFVSFENEEEKAAVLAAAEKYAQHRANAVSQQKAGEVVEKPEHAFSPVPEKGQNALFDKLVRGSYTLPSAAPHKQHLLNDIVRSTLNNSTYLEEDQSKLLKKIRSLLPSESAAARKPAPKSRK